MFVQVFVINNAIINLVLKPFLFFLNYIWVSGSFNLNIFKVKFRSLTPVNTFAPTSITKMKKVVLFNL